MNNTVFRFSFKPEVDLTEAEATLQMAILASEGLFGEAQVRTETAYHADLPASVITIDGHTPAGTALVRIFTSLLAREFGPDAFAVQRAPASSAPTNPEAANEAAAMVAAA